MIDLSTADVITIAIYFLIIFYTAFFLTRKDKSNSESSDYFLAGRNLSWFLVGSSLFASNIGSEHLIGLAGTGASSGVAVAQFEILACFILLILGWFFVPFYLKSGVFTMPEFLEMRFSSGARMYLSVISVLAYVITKISATIYAGAVVFETIGVPFWTGASIVVIATGIYTVFGGLRAVIYTDAVQMVIMILGSILLTIFGLNQLGGWGELQATIPADFMSMWKPATHKDFPWTGIIFGAPILGVWYWCTDQFVVQRVLSAKNITEARRGTIFGGFLKVLPLFIFVIPGLIAYALSQKGALELASNDQALPVLIGSIVPTGLKGLLIASLLAALMSSLSSVFNSCSTLITYDFYKKISPNTSEKKLVAFGQACTVILVLMGMAWIPLMKIISGELFTYLQKVQAYISPPIAAVFIFGILFKTLNSTGALWALWSGFIIGVSRLGLELASSKVTLSPMLQSFVEINFLHFAFILFVICSVVFTIASKLSPQTQTEAQLALTRTPGGSAFGDEEKKDAILSLLLCVVIFSIWFYFS